jgi:hypothetical protein
LTTDHRKIRKIGNTRVNYTMPRWERENIKSGVINYMRKNPSTYISYKERRREQKPDLIENREYWSKNSKKDKYGIPRDDDGYETFGCQVIPDSAKKRKQRTNKSKKPVRKVVAKRKLTVRGRK